MTLSSPATSDGVVKLFESVAEAARQIGGATRNAVGIAGKARAFWNHPDFLALAELIGSAKEEIKSVDLVEKALGRCIDQAKPMFRSGFPIPPLPTPLKDQAHAALGHIVAAASGHVGGLMSGLSLGVGLFSLGAGIYNIFQLKRLGRQLGELQADVATGFARVEMSLAWQSHQIAVLAAGQDDIADQLQRLRRDLQLGLERVVGTISNLDERRIADDYQTQVTLLAERYRTLQETLLEGYTPNDRDLGRLLDAGETLAAWVKPKLLRTQPGDPARLPYRVAQAMAARACGDVHGIEGGQKQADRTINRLVDEIATDVFTLCDKGSLHWLGIEIPDLIAQYVYLFRGLKVGNN